MQSKLAEAKDAYDKISKDENIFRDYVNKYSSDWDDYNKSNPTKNDKFELAKSAYDKAKLAADKANANLEKVSNNVKSAYTTFLEKSAAAYLSDEMYVNINDLFDYKTSKFKEGSKSYKDKDGNNYDINVTTKDGITTITASNKTNDGYTAENTIKVPNNTAGIELAITKSVEFSKKANDEFNKAEANARQSIELKEAAAADLEKAGNDLQNSVQKMNNINKEINEAKAKAVTELYNKYKNGEISASEFTELKEEVKAIDMTSDYEKVETMASLKEKIDAFKVDDINETNYEQKQNEIAGLEAQLANIGNETLIDLTKTMMGQGKTIEDIRETEEFKSFSTELFTLAQNIYDKADTIENVMVSMGLDKPGKEAGIIDKAITTVEAAYDAVKNGQPLNANQGYAVLHCMDSIQGVKSAAEALMKSAAFNGASNIKGGKAAEAMKQEAATKLSWKDWASTSAWGTLGILATSVGIVTGNPILIGAGIYVNLKAGGNFAGKVTMSNVTKEQQMFGMGDDNSAIMDKAIEVYNQSQEPANVGDPKSASTYATAGTAVVDALVGMVMLSNPATIINGISHIKESISEFAKITKGGLEGNAKVLVNNIYNFAWAAQAITGKDLSIPTMGDVISFIDNISGDFDNDLNSGYGIAADIDDIDDKYSGYIEKAKNSNIATDYNEGMEKEINEAVSDMRVKIYKVYSSEPDYIRKAIEKILKSYKEQW